MEMERSKILHEAQESQEEKKTDEEVEKKTNVEITEVILYDLYGYLYRCKKCDIQIKASRYFVHLLTAESLYISIAKL